MAAEKKTETTDETDETDDLQAITGSGTPKVKVRANVNYGALQAGQIGIMDDTEEIRLDAQSKYVEIINE